MPVPKLLAILLFLSSLALRGQSVDSLPYTWLVELTDSLKSETQFCGDCLTKPTIKQFIANRGDLQFRMNYNCGEENSASIIYDASGMILGKCIVSGATRDCEDGIGSAFTGFTFSTSIREIWTCSAGFDCQSQNELELFEPYTIDVERLFCDKPDRRLTTSRPFFDYTWVDPDGKLINGVETIAKRSGDYTLIVGDRQGCKDTTLIPFDLQDFDLKVSGMPLICDDDGTQLSATGYESYAWSTGSTDSTSWFDEAGMYSMTAVDKLGCRDSLIFNVGDLSRRSVEIGTEQEVVFIGQPFQLELLLDGYVTDQVASSTWKTSHGSMTCQDCLNPVMTIDEPTELWIKILDRDGCSQVDSILINPLAAYKESYTGNAFSPNGDGQNDLFMLRSIEGTMNVLQFKIFDRWGTPIYEAMPHAINDVSQAWDGLFGAQPAPTGTYLWMAELAYTDGSTEIVKGSVALIR